MSEVTLDQVFTAKQRRDELKLKLANLKSDAKIVREDLKAAESLYDALVGDLCDGQGQLPLSDPETVPAEKSGGDLVTNRPGAWRDPERDAKPGPKKPARKPVIGRRKSAILPEGPQ